MFESLMSKSRLLSRASCLAMLVCARAIPALAADDPVVALPPFIVTGRVVDYDGAGLKTAEVRVRKGSLLLARLCEAVRTGASGGSG